MIDELIDAFEADAFHVGMDEVFIVAHPSCPRCKGKDPAELFAKSVNDLHRHIAGERKLTMLMWADRLLDDKKLGYGKWEASANGTAGAIDNIPKDIILCDWHYETRKDGYPSVAYLQEKGFRVLPSSWRNKDAALAMLREARQGDSAHARPHLHDLDECAGRLPRAPGRAAARAGQAQSRGEGEGEDQDRSAAGRARSWPRSRPAWRS